MRVDVAVVLGPNRVTTFVDAIPSVFVQESPHAVAGTTTPTMQFSSYPADVIRSSLTGASIRDLVTSETDGVEAQVRVSVGYFIRF